MRLHEAANGLRKKIVPRTPLPRPRAFWIVPGQVAWPYQDDLDRVSVRGYGEVCTTARTAERIAELCGFQPRRILRALRRIQAAEAWCRARIEGRRRAAEEIVRQQARAVSVLEAEIAMGKLAE